MYGRKLGTDFRTETHGDRGTGGKTRRGCAARRDQEKGKKKMSDFATVQDVIDLWRPLTAEEVAKVGSLLPVVSDLLRNAATNVGKDIDSMVEASTVYATVVKSVTVDVISRIVRQSTTGEPMTQESQSALGYSWSGTFAIPGGGIGGAIMHNDLKRLGLLRQQIGGIELYDYGNNSNNT